MFSNYKKEWRPVKATRGVKKFYVVHFKEVPYLGIKRYVIVPFIWLRLLNLWNSTVKVAYPVEDPGETRKRVEREEIFRYYWGTYIAVIAYGFDDYVGAELWIATMLIQDSITLGTDIDDPSNDAVLDIVIKSNDTPDSFAEMALTASTDNIPLVRDIDAPVTDLQRETSCQNGWANPTRNKSTGPRKTNNNQPSEKFKEPLLSNKENYSSSTQEMENGTNGTASTQSTAMDPATDTAMPTSITQAHQSSSRSQPRLSVVSKDFLFNENHGDPRSEKSMFQAIERLIYKKSQEPQLVQADPSSKMYDSQLYQQLYKQNALKESTKKKSIRHEPYPRNISNNTPQNLALQKSKNPENYSRQLPKHSKGKQKTSDNNIIRMQNSYPNEAIILQEKPHASKDIIAHFTQKKSTTKNVPTDTNSKYVAKRPGQTSQSSVEKQFPPAPTEQLQVLQHDSRAHKKIVQTSHTGGNLKNIFQNKANSTPPAVDYFSNAENQSVLLSKTFNEIHISKDRQEDLRPVSSPQRLLNEPGAVHGLVEQRPGLQGTTHDKQSAVHNHPTSANQSCQISENSHQQQPKAAVQAYILQDPRTGSKPKLNDHSQSPSAQPPTQTINDTPEESFPCPESSTEDRSKYIQNSSNTIEGTIFDRSRAGIVLKNDFDNICSKINSKLDERYKMINDIYNKCVRCDEAYKRVVDRFSNYL